MKFLLRPYHLLLLSSAVFLVLCLSMKGGTIDFSLRDDYFIMDRTFLFGGFSFYLFVAWLVHRVPDQLLFSRSITWIYAIITIGSMAFLAAFSTWEPSPYKNVDNVPLLTEDYARYLPYIIIAFVIAQILLLVNVVAGLVTKLRHVPPKPDEYYREEFWKQHRKEQEKKRKKELELLKKKQNELSRSQHK